MPDLIVTRGRRPRSLLDRLLDRLLIGDGCWLWSGRLMNTGYGVIAMGPPWRMVLTHRASWEVFCGPIPEGLCVLHHCDVRTCCRPDHLFLGTKADNNQDKARKGRSERGEKRHNAKLTAACVAAIRKQYSEGMTQRELALSYGVCQSRISRVVNRHRWKHVP